jgi:hypothetical protein
MEEKRPFYRKIRPNVTRYRLAVFRSGERVIAFTVLIVVTQRRDSQTPTRLCPCHLLTVFAAGAIARGRKRTRKNRLSSGDRVFRIRVRSRPTRRRQLRDENR